MARGKTSAVSSGAGRTLLVGVLLIAAMIGAVAFALRANYGLPVGVHSYAKLAFSDVGPLRENDEVRMNSIRIGRVERIELQPGRAVVTVKLDGRKTIYRDASAALSSRSGLGQKFVNIDPGTPAAGPLGENVLAVDRTESEIELDDVLSAFDPETRTALGASLRELGGGAAGHGQDLQDALAAAPSLLPNVATVSKALASEQAALPALLAHGRQLTGRFAGREEHISRLITEFDATVRAIAVDNGQPLDKTIKALPTTLDKADRALRRVVGPLGDTESALAGLRDGAAGLGKATGDVRGVLTESPEPLNKVPSVSDEATPALVDLTATVSDLRPLAPRVAKALDTARTPLAVLSPYHQDIVRFFIDIKSALSQADGDKHWLRLLVSPSTELATGAVPGVADPTVSREPYPAPDEMRTLRKSTVTGNR